MCQSLFLAWRCIYFIYLVIDRLRNWGKEKLCGPIKTLFGFKANHLFNKRYKHRHEKMSS